MRELVFKELWLQNFRNHEELTFSFSPNRFVAIVGDNGTGKTTIFSALTWCLYDKTMDGQSGDDVIRRRSGKNAIVGVEWSVGDDDYKVVAHRKHKKFKNRRFLYKNGDDISGNTEADTLNLIQNIVMPREVFLNCLLFSQYAKSHFMDLTYSGQRGLIDLVLSVSDYEEYRTRVAATEKREELGITKVGGKIAVVESLIEEKGSQLSYAGDHLDGIQQRFDIEKKSLPARIAQLKGELKGLTANNEVIEEANKEYARLREESSALHAKVESQRESYKKEIDDLNGIMILERTSKGRDVENKFQTEVNRLQKKKHDIDSRKAEVEKKLSDLMLKLEQQATTAIDKKKEEFKSQLQPITEERDQLVSDNRLHKNELTSKHREKEEAQEKLEKYRAALEKENPECAACGQELVDKKALAKIQKLSKHYQNTVKNVQASIDSDEELCRNDEVRLDTLNATIGEIEETAKAELIALRDKIEAKRKEVREQFDIQLVEITKEENELREESTKITKKKNEVFATIEFAIDAEKEKRIQRIKNSNQEIAMPWLIRIKAIEPELDAVTQSIEQFNIVGEQISQKEQEIASVQTSLVEAKSRYKSDSVASKKRIASIEEEIVEQREKLNKYEEEIARRKRKLSIIEFWKKAFSDTGIKAILLDESIPILNERARELCQLTPNLRVRFNSQTQLKSGENRNKFSIDVLQTTNLSELKDLSAGERRMTDIIVLLCLRHLLETIQNCKMNILLLDEILDSLDPKNITVAVEMIKGLADTHCVALISHTLRECLEADETLCL